MADFTSIEVTDGPRTGPDGLAAAGTVVFELTGTMTNTLSGVAIAPRTFVVEYNSAGSLAVPLPANDDATTSPPNAQYRVTISVVGAPVETGYVTVPSDTPGGTATLASLLAA